MIFTISWIAAAGTSFSLTWLAADVYYRYVEEKCGALAKQVEGWVSKSRGSLITRFYT